MSKNRKDNAHIAVLRRFYAAVKGFVYIGWSRLRLVPQKSAKQIETRKEIAKIDGVSHDTVSLTNLF